MNCWFGCGGFWGADFGGDFLVRPRATLGCPPPWMRGNPGLTWLRAPWAEPTGMVSINSGIPWFRDWWLRNSSTEGGEHSKVVTPRFFLGNRLGGKNPPPNPQQNSHQNLGASRPKSTLRGSALDTLGDSHRCFLVARKPHELIWRGAVS